MTWIVLAAALLLTALAVLLLLADRCDSTLLDDHPPHRDHPPDLPTDNDGDDDP